MLTMTPSADICETALEWAIEKLFNETRLSPEGVLVSSDSHQALIEVLSDPAKVIFFPLRSNIVVIFGFPSFAWAVFNRKNIVYSEGA